MKKISEANYIENVSEFITSVLSKIATLGSEKAVWFRGEGSEKYSLVPNLYRSTKMDENQYCQDILNPKKVYQIEQNIDTSFYRKSTIFLANKGIANTPWNRYFLKQHYGVKTRLLDWTENALFSLFFAVSDSRTGDHNGKVWLLSPCKLNNYSLYKLHPSDKKFYGILTCGKLEKKGELINKKGELRISEWLRKYYRMDCSDNEKMYPLAIYPLHLDERMAAQQACFTLFGNVARGLDCNDSSQKLLDCIYINSESKPKILSELRSLGISTYSIYPDLDGLGRTINYDHSNDILQAHEDNELSNLFKSISS